jgi:alkaline phosphatase D
MTNLRLLLAAFHGLSLTVLLPAGYPESDAGLTIETIAFGSCAKDREPQPIWREIREQAPDLFLFLGDNVYADTWIEDGQEVSGPVASREAFTEAYARLDAQPGFRELRKETPFLGIWDDHDYGDNDGGKNYSFKAESQAAFWDFFGLPVEHPQREQEGIHHARVFGPIGQRVQIILLDTRSFRDDLDWKSDPEAPGRYQPTPDTSRNMLGEMQWKWLEKQLRLPAELRIIASSIQVLADEHGWEMWGNLPHERQRFFELIEETQAEGVLVLSGDRHLTEFSRAEGVENAPMRYPLWDFTSSGMNEDRAEVQSENRLRIGAAYKGATFGLLRLEWSGDEGLSGLTVTMESRAPGGKLIHRQVVPGHELMRE